MERKDIRPAIKEWARWYMGTARSGYSDSTTIYRAMRSPIHPPAGSQIPMGVIPWVSVEDVCWAMNQLLEQEHARKPISVLRWFYCYGPERTAKELRMTKVWAYKWKGRGEDLMRSKLLEWSDHLTSV